MKQEKIQKLFDNFIQCTEVVKELERQLDVAKTNLQENMSALGKELTPAGAKEGEEFSIWVVHDDIARLLTIKTPQGHIAGYGISLR